MIQLKKIIGFAITFLILNTTFAQEGEWIEVRDFETWSSVSATMKLNKDWKFSLSEQLRLKNNSKEVDVYFTQLEAEYSGFNGFRLGAGLRYIKDNDNQGKIQGYETHFRYQFDLGYKHKVDRFKLGYRLRYQNKSELGLDELAESYAINKLRLKIGAEYNIKGWKLDPKFSSELFYRTQETTESNFEKIRFTLGTSYDLKKFGKINGFYRIERELNPTYVNYPKTTHIVGLSYVYTFKITTK